MCDYCKGEDGHSIWKSLECKAVVICVFDSSIGIRKEMDYIMLKVGGISDASSPEAFQIFTFWKYFLSRLQAFNQ